jgi:hypothetical protein
VIRTLGKVLDTLKRIDRHLHIIARTMEARALSENAFATDKQLFTDPNKHVRHTIGTTHTGPVKEDEPQCELEEFE